MYLCYCTKWSSWTTVSCAGGWKLWKTWEVSSISSYWRKVKNTVQVESERHVALVHGDKCSGRRLWGKKCAVLYSTLSVWTDNLAMTKMLDWDYLNREDRPWAEKVWVASAVLAIECVLQWDPGVNYWGKRCENSLDAGWRSNLGTIRRDRMEGWRKSVLSYLRNRRVAWERRWRWSTGPKAWQGMSHWTLDLKYFHWSVVAESLIFEDWCNLSKTTPAMLERGK